MLQININYKIVNSAATHRQVSYEFLFYGRKRQVYMYKYFNILFFFNFYVQV